MNDDKTLLELAAKAAGLYEEWPEPDFGIQWNGEGLWCFGQGQGELWNPLTDDGDALRLAVKCGIDLDVFKDEIISWIQVGCGYFEINEKANGDLYAATRRAIVRAAAEIGRTL